MERNLNTKEILIYIINKYIPECDKKDVLLNQIKHIIKVILPSAFISDFVSLLKENNESDNTTQLYESIKLLLYNFDDKIGWKVKLFLYIVQCNLNRYEQNLDLKILLNDVYLKNNIINLFYN